MNNDEAIQVVEGSPRVSVAVTFLSSEQGGRSQKAYDSPRYRPHLVVGDPKQRVALTDGSGTGIEDYLGVQFTGDGSELPTGVEFTVSLALMHYPRVDYSALSTGTTFSVREGGRVIGFGRVLRGLADAVSLEGPVEIVDGELAILVPLDAGGAVLAPLAKGIGEIDGEFLKVVIQPWLAEKLRIGAGSLVNVDNLNGKFTITRSAANDEASQ
jgi:hypothetical protein